ncbi:HAMP domain-containing methyl-accepting chemotaxis protein [Rhodoplanes sp. TEM]|uniref:HAMP domain-containing methyl-accepting chemotaxis protein n=1 Tax=Rhodoplanes tepidamans TaxID=200616 RepID=A0ABT5JEJ6_RHOTP|nr:MULTISPECIES: HAMP domain-containing methyl-accepting chemotaxis protein [Rhodoplanes]MDC7787490.1 HAMP domain-containing methyl-accepting chemotaxis protein [Rhodoplanes tepidamans]MDC7983919.1 HAMP domain-containing methyl-accepting chemotaxis protein [Rhodoplanes sp. TEM]MDQ0354358.1 methyl-accepting chemotaxis protein [Rhodoplanes tepidamans]
MSLSNVKILYKILGCFVLLLAVVGGAVWFTSTRMAAVDASYSDILVRDVSGMKSGQRANQEVFNLGRLTWRIIAETDMADMRRTAEEMAANRKRFVDHIAAAKQNLPGFVGPLDDALARFEALQADAAAVAKASMAGNNVEALRLAKAMVATTAALREHMQRITANVEQALDRRSAEASAAVVDTIRLTVTAIGTAALLVLALAFAVAQFGVARPLGVLSRTMERLAGGDLEADVAGTERKDEVGLMARSVAVFKQNGLETLRLRRAQQEAEANAAAARKADMARMADRFEGAVGTIVEAVSSAATELEAAAGTLSRTAQTTQERAGAVAAASEQASGNVQSVASATNELSASVNEISRQVQESTRIAAEAVRQAERTDARIGELSQAAGRIGDVVKLITAIAEQTNLLALNATIEAARAGEAGKGFAVVAQEVKALAAQTGKATGDISAQIAGMQAATDDSVAAIKEIGGTIGRVAEIASTIAAAVEEQGAATGEIARNVQEAARGTTEVAANVTDVNQGAEETGAASAQVLSSAQSLSKDSNALARELATFLATVRAA